ncbi:hypothetical protein Ancab_028823, partial [Ancistrocladus abbreviatus]
MIYSQFSKEEISFIQFVYINESNCRPIVVKAKGKKEPPFALFFFLEKKKGKKQCSYKSQKNFGPLEYHVAPTSPYADLPAAASPAANALVKQKPSETTEKSKLSRENQKFNRLQKIKEPCYY